MTKQVIHYGKHPSQFVEAWFPENRSPDSAVVLLHGGWWRAKHGLHLMDELAADLHQRGHLVWNVEYRRIDGDGGGWPETLDDVLAAIQSLTSEVSQVNPSSIAIIGHSAGGHLALLAAKTARLAAVVALAPITDVARCAAEGLGEGATPAFLKHVGLTKEVFKEASPLEQAPIGAPQLVVHGSDDARVPLSHSQAYVSRATRVGDSVELREVQEGDHMFVLQPGHSYWPKAMEWLNDVTAGLSSLPPAGQCKHLT
ncbi:S9 family peptidase [Paenarthrobacter nitroguajacolicus]|uniref:alpha/beta hydrolase family protein n=1 Tax=Paenarthrobacter nitroguajacolicus TaxID=211146 RepID=UPI001AE7C6D1|nr:alpha/beta hydrolase [Paenarthrobacter nitroguajacolicus]MDR6639543.1 acetyl esterase/lipase [Paenarthrobacter nitroguajacolicus]